MPSLDPVEIARRCAACARAVRAPPMAASPSTSVMNSRRLIASSEAKDRASYRPKPSTLESADVRPGTSHRAAGRCPLWVKSRHVRCERPCPLWAKSGLMQCGKLGSLFEHVVGAGEQRGWDGDAEHLRGLEIDDEFECGGELNGQMGNGGA